MVEGWEVRGPVRKEPMPEVSVGPPFPERTEGQTPAFKLDLEEAKDASELHAIYRDLEYVIEATDYLVRIVRQREEQEEATVAIASSGIVERALYIAALVTYVRCFTSGKREYKLDESIFTGDAEHLLDRHRHCRDTRDKHVAHSVNAFEFTEFIAWVDDMDTEEPRVRSVGSIHSTRTSDVLDDLQWMLKLATYVQTIVYGRMNRVNIALSTKTHALPKEELKKLEVLIVQPPQGPEAAGTPRS